MAVLLHIHSHYGRMYVFLLGVFLCVYTLALNGDNIPKEGDVINKMAVTMY